MLGYLIPCGGGRTIPLPKPRLIIGPRPAPNVQGTRIAHAELVYADGIWSVEQLPGGATLRINDVPCEFGTLLPGDVIAVGSLRFRLTAAESDAAQTPPAAPKPAPSAAPQPSVFGVLVPCGGGPVIPLKKSKFVIGRASSCDLVLVHKAVSSWHCALERLDGHWRVLDLGSNNGTYVDGVSFHRKWLFPGNIVGVVAHRYRLEYVPEGPRPPVPDDDVPRMSNLSLTASVGMTERQLEKLAAASDGSA